MITIHNLEVRFEVEGDGDEAVFARLFNRYMDEWARLQQEQQRLDQMANNERALGDFRHEGQS